MRGTHCQSARQDFWIVHRLQVEIRSAISLTTMIRNHFEGQRGRVDKFHRIPLIVSNISRLLPFLAEAIRLDASSCNILKGV